MKVTLGEWKGGLWKCKLEWFYWLSEFSSSCHKEVEVGRPPGSRISGVIECRHTAFVATERSVMSAVERQQRKMPRCSHLHYSRTYLCSFEEKYLFRPGLLCQFFSKWVANTTVECGIIVGSVLRWTFFYFNNSILLIMLNILFIVSNTDFLFRVVTENFLSKYTCTK